MTSQTEGHSVTYNYHSLHHVQCLLVIFNYLKMQT